MKQPIICAKRLRAKVKNWGGGGGGVAKAPPLSRHTLHHRGPSVKLVSWVQVHDW